MDEPIKDTTIAAVLEKYFSGDIPFEFGLELRGRVSTGYLRVVLFCDGLAPSELKVIYRYLQGHPRLMGITQTKERFDFFANVAWAERLGANYERG